MRAKDSAVDRWLLGQATWKILIHFIKNDYLDF